MNDDPISLVADLLRKQADRPLGDVERVSSRALTPFSNAAWEAADNLLTRARRALEAGDRDRAAAYVDRAVALPFDEHEGASPAAVVVATELYSLVSEEVEYAREHDTSWLDVALDLLATTDGPARFDLRDALRDIDQDYQLEKRERHRLRAAIAPIPDQPVLSDQGDLPHEELSRRVMAILELCAAYEAALEALPLE